MAKFTNPLDGVRVAAPCRADWEKMVGDERMRYCGQCSLHVYNLSGMTRREAETLITNAEGRLCVRFYRRVDGSVLTHNCPVGLRALKQRVSRVAGATLSAVLGFFAGVGLNLGFAHAPHVMGTIAQRPVRQEEIEVPPLPPVPKDTHVMMGAVALPQPTMGKMEVGSEQPRAVTIVNKVLEVRADVRRTK